MHDFSAAFALRGGHAIRFLLLLAMLLSGCAIGTPDRHVDRATAERFQQYVEDLAHPRMEGRGVGYAGLDLARDYLVDHFAEVGLRPAFITDAGEASFTQALDVQLGARASEQSLGYESDRAEGEFEADEAFNTLGFSGQGTFAGEAVFVGYGIVAPEHDYDSYANLPDDALAGKVAIAFRYEPRDADGRSRWAGVDGQPGRFSAFASLPRKAQWAAERGAVALLLVDPPSLARTSHGSLRSTAGSDFPGRPATIPVMHIHSDALRTLLGHADMNLRPTLRSLENRANRGAGHAAILTGVHVRGEVRIEYPHTTIHNVAGYLPGRGTLAGETIVIGAHYDHLGFGEVGSLADPATLPALHPGADDNASGTAGLMLLAARAVERADHAENGSDRRSLLFVGFTGEERGLLGSMHMVQHPEQLAIDFDQIVAMINLDMIGRLGSELFIFGSESGDRWTTLLQQLGDELNLNLQFAGDGLGLSDQTSFYMHRIPVLHIFTGIHDNYHRPSDKPDTINAIGGARVVEFADRLTHRLASDRERIAFTGSADPHAWMDMHNHDGDRRHDHLASPGRAKLGVMPDYATLNGEQGAGITAVLPGSPAETAGLRAGDRMVRWNHQPMRNIRTLTELLRKAKPGERIELVVERGDERLVIEVELGRR